jgi:hypothetical protein
MGSLAALLGQLREGGGEQRVAFARALASEGGFAVLIGALRRHTAPGRVELLSMLLQALAWLTVLVAGLPQAEEASGAVQAALAVTHGDECAQECGLVVLLHVLMAEGGRWLPPAQAVGAACGALAGGGMAESPRVVEASCLLIATLTSFVGADEGLAPLLGLLCKAGASADVRGSASAASAWCAAVSHCVAMVEGAAAFLAQAGAAGLLVAAARAHARRPTSTCVLSRRWRAWLAMRPAGRP